MVAASWRNAESLTYVLADWYMDVHHLLGAGVYEEDASTF